MAKKGGKKVKYKKGDKFVKEVKLKIESVDTHSTNLPYKVMMEGLKSPRWVSEDFLDEAERFLDDGVYQVKISEHGRDQPVLRYFIRREGGWFSASGYEEALVDVDKYHTFDVMGKLVRIDTGTDRLEAVDGLIEIR